jgi:hypothetical protein
MPSRLLYSCERTYLWGRPPRPSVSHDEQKQMCKREPNQKKKEDIPGVQSTFPNGIPVGEPRQESLKCAWERGAKVKE